MGNQSIHRVYPYENSCLVAEKQHKYLYNLRHGANDRVARYTKVYSSLKIERFSLLVLILVLITPNLTNESIQNENKYLIGLSEKIN